MENSFLPALKGEKEMKHLWGQGNSIPILFPLSSFTGIFHVFSSTIAKRLHQVSLLSNSSKVGLTTPRTYKNVCECVLRRDGLMFWSENERRGSFIYFFSVITTTITVNILVLNDSETAVIYSVKWILNKFLLTSRKTYSLLLPLTPSCSVYVCEEKLEKFEWFSVIFIISLMMKNSVVFICLDIYFYFDTSRRALESFRLSPVVLSSASVVLLESFA